jgi:spermidine synthase
MLARVGGPQLDILRASPDFRPAYDPLLNQAAALAASQADEAKALLAALAGIQPARPEAARWLERLADAPASASLR